MSSRERFGCTDGNRLTPQSSCVAACSLNGEIELASDSSSEEGNVLHSWIPDYWYGELETGNRNQAKVFVDMTQSNEYVRQTMNDVVDFLIG